MYFRDVFLFSSLFLLHLTPKIYTPFQTFQTKKAKTIPYFRLKRLQNHTLKCGTYLYSSYMGVTPPHPHPLPAMALIIVIVQVFSLLELLVAICMTICDSRLLHEIKIIDMQRVQSITPGFHAPIKSLRLSSLVFII